MIDRILNYLGQKIEIKFVKCLIAIIRHSNDNICVLQLSQIALVSVLLKSKNYETS